MRWDRRTLYLNVADDPLMEAEVLILLGRPSLRYDALVSRKLNHQGLAYGLSTNG